MILYFTSVIVFLVVSLNLFFRAACPAWLKICGSLFILFIACKYVIYQVFGGAFFAPGLSRSFVVIMEAFYGSLLLLFFFLLLWDVYLLGNWLLLKIGIPVPRSLPYGKIKIGLVAASLIFGFWGTWQAIKVPDVKTVEITLKKLPPALDGFIIAQLSDLHIGPILNRAWLEQVVTKTNAIEPDLILLTGDYVDGTVSELLNELEPLARLRARYGVFGVTGNHEYYWNAAEWLKALQGLNIRLLTNEHEVVKVNDESLVVAGLPDLVAEKFGFAAPDIKAAVANAPEAVTILLAHQPKNSREYAPYADLHLAGHTHGGLIFFLRPLIAKFNNGYVVGQYESGDETLYVNPGTGLWNGFSSRIGNPSEITKIILRAPAR